MSLRQVERVFSIIRTANTSQAWEIISTSCSCPITSLSEDTGTMNNPAFNSQWKRPQTIAFAKIKDDLTIKRLLSKEKFQSLYVSAVAWRPQAAILFLCFCSHVGQRVSERGAVPRAPTGRLKTARACDHMDRPYSVCAQLFSPFLTLTKKKITALSLLMEMTSDWTPCPSQGSIPCRAVCLCLSTCNW